MTDFDPALYSKEISYLRNCGNMTVGVQELISQGIAPSLIWQLWKAAHPNQTTQQQTAQQRQQAVYASLARERAKRKRKAIQERHRLGSA